MKLKSTFVGFLTLVSVLLMSSALAVTERVVYPQAVVGPAGAESFDIELFLGNRNSEEAWTGVIRLLESDQLTGFSAVTLIDPDK